MNELIEAFWIEQGGKAHMVEDLWFYESDYNMLMPVVEKIHESKTYESRHAKTPIGVEITIKPKFCSIELPDTSEGYDYVEGCYYAEPLFRVYVTKNTMHTNIYKAVVEYIKWFNKQKNGIS